MTDAQLYSAILSLPSDLRKEVVELIKHLRAKTKPHLKARQIGCAKGLIEFTPNFDEPLEDFGEYI
ncbi:MAG: DUF2281 domain-containing protein [Chitinophagaceae bacterium]|nr:DUF2281 domain-containing protein [Chitinophagaceae bacterium]